MIQKEIHRTSQWKQYTTRKWWESRQKGIIVFSLKANNIEERNDIISRRIHYCSRKKNTPRRVTTGSKGNGNIHWDRVEISIKVADCPRPIIAFAPPACSTLVISSYLWLINFFSMIIRFFWSQKWDKRSFNALLILNHWKDISYY